jgi:DNA ligase-associated metallophosphoesterase
MDEGYRLLWRDEPLLLLAERALWLARTTTLVIADPHFGKTATFRAAGIPLPPGTTSSDLERLTQLIARWQPARLLVLGDFWHAREGRADATEAAIADWRDQHAQLAITIVRGNHDRRAGDPPAACNMQCVDEPLLESPFAWRHFPGQEPDHYVIAGHLHPVITLRGHGDKLRAPCFHFGPSCAVLPAFSRFTGGSEISPRPGDRVLAVGPDCVRAIL